MTTFLATLHDLRYVIATGLLIWAAAWTIVKVYGWSCAEVDRMVAEALVEAAADFAEPTRAQVEADMRDDREWADILAAVGLTPEDVRRRWRDAQTPIHDELAVERLRADLDAWGGDVA